MKLFTSILISLFCTQIYSQKMDSIKVFEGLIFDDNTLDFHYSSTLNGNQIRLECGGYLPFTSDLNVLTLDTTFYMGNADTVEFKYFVHSSLGADHKVEINDSVILDRCIGDPSPFRNALVFRSGENLEYIPCIDGTTIHKCNKVEIWLRFKSKPAVSLNEYILPHNFSVYPVPAIDHLKFEQLEWTGVECEIFNLQGLQVLSPKIENGTINISCLGKGTYFVRVKNASGKVYSSKFVK